MHLKIPTLSKSNKKTLVDDDQELTQALNGVGVLVLKNIRYSLNTN